MDVETEARRSDRWAVESRAPRNWWTPVAAVIVASGYGVAVVVAALARGSMELPDDTQIALVAMAPSLGVIGAILAFVGARRRTLTVFSWLVFALGVMLVVAALAVLAMIVSALTALG